MILQLNQFGNAFEPEHYFCDNESCFKTEIFNYYHPRNGFFFKSFYLWYYLFNNTEKLYIFYHLKYDKVFKSKYTVSWLNMFQNYENVKTTNYYFKQPFHRRVMKYSFTIDKRIINLKQNKNLPNHKILKRCPC